MRYRLVFLLVALSLLTSAQAQASGEQGYRQCAACHLPTGAGVPGMFPPLTQRLGELAGHQPGRDYLVMVIQAGLMGSLTIEGIRYQGMMPAQGGSLGDKGIAEVINYLLQTFNAETLASSSKPFDAEEVSAIKARYPKASGYDIYQLRKAAFPGPAGVQ